MAIDRSTDLPKAWGITSEMMANPKPRIPLIEPGHIPDDLRKELEPFYNKSVEKWGTVPRFFQMLAHSPVLVEAWQLIDSRVRFGYLKTDPEFLKILQLVIIKTAILNHGSYCTGHNVGLGRTVGLTWDQIDAVEGGGWSTTESLSPREKAAVEWAVAVTKGTAHDDEKAFQTLKRYFTNRQIVEITFICGMWTLSARLTEPFHLDVELPEDRIDFNAKRGRDPKVSAA
jgi:alkylhydroperoxidase family enzyme